MATNLKTYVVDLDNTLCDTKTENGKPDYIGALPFTDRIKKVNELYDQGHRIIIETARGNTSKKNWYEQTYHQLISFGLKFHELRTGVKFIADAYIDDKAIHCDDFFNDSKEEQLKKESGGKTNVVLVNRVFKEATNERMSKLVDEYNFISSIPEKFKKYFPKIIFYGTEGNKAFYEMEHYNLPTLRRLMLSNQITRKEVLYWVDKITNVSLEFYSYEKLDFPKDFFDKMHFNRLFSRLDECAEKSDWFKEKLSQDTVIVNNKEYKNIHILAEKFKNNKFLETVMPEFVGRWSHSDLHFSNVLIDRNNDTFIMIDPRGYDYCDYYYDFGKLWHSVNGKYEMIASRQFVCTDDSYSLASNSMFGLCEGLKDGIFDILVKYSNESPEAVLKKTEWNEVIHFCSLIPFLFDFDGKDERSKVAYFTSLKLINDFCKKYAID